MWLANVLSFWPAVVFGWPAVAVSLLLFHLGLRAASRRLAVAGAFVTAPFASWVSGYPAVGVAAPLAWLLFLLGALLVGTRRRWAPLLLCLPFVLVAVYVAVTVVRQWT